MQRKFSLFQSHLDLAHAYWTTLLRDGGWAIDSTCGGGRDTLKLARILSGREESGVIGIDIQKDAIERTEALLDGEGSARAQVHLFHQSHEEFPPLAYERPVRLIVYNLGYLPGGDKENTTLTPTTLASIERALELVQPGGALSITCYPGHKEGAREAQAVQELAAGLSPAEWNVCLHTHLNRSASPQLLLLQKNSI
jgi:Putative rRNA methylase